MRVLFAVSNDKMSETIVKRYQKEYKQIISYKNVYYFNAILKELQRDKTYDRIVISEDLEEYVNSDYEKRDNFIFGRLDSISDEASNMNGEDIPILLICSERRTKSEPILVKLFGIGIYNAIIGTDRSVPEVCRLLNRPRSKKEAKIYYKIDADDVTYQKENENDVSELEIQNILAHYKKLGKDEDRYVESFDSIAAQYNDEQLKVISQCLPLNVRAVLEEKSVKYQKVNSYNNKISEKVKVSKKQEVPGTSEILLKNAKSANINEPVVIPSAIDTTKKRKVLKDQNSIIDEEQLVNNRNSVEKTKEIIDETFNMEDDVEDISKIQQPMVEEQKDISEQQEQPVKRKRGRPRKIVEEPIVQGPKRKRGRPRKNPLPEDVENVNELMQNTEFEGNSVLQKTENQEDDEDILLGYNNDGDLEKNDILPGFDEEDEEETELPGFDEEDEEETALPGFDEEDEEETALPGFDEEDEEETALPGFDEEDEEESTLPGFDEEDDELPEIDTIEEPEEDIIYTKPLVNTKNNNEINQDNPLRRINKKSISDDELNMDEIIDSNQKLIAFVGTSKNGTSFLVNNVAELLSTNGIDTAILDLTHNRNGYYIYTKNDDELREQSNHIFEELTNGRANGIKEHNNLTIYTSGFEDDENLQNVEPIVESLLKRHMVVLMDCDFTTPMKYFKYAQEIYLVQSMDILTIQPLTAYLRKLKDKGMLEESKVRVILNKFMKTREIDERLLIGGISIYNDAAMTVRKELFNRKTVPYLTVPFELKTYLRYLDGLVVCDVSLKGYSKEFMQSLKKLANMIYQGGNNTGKYEPPSAKNSNVFSRNMNNTLNQMKQNY